MKTFLFPFACLVTLSLGASLPVSAAETGVKEHPCKADVQKFCKDVKPGKGAIMNCLKSHDAELSEACKNHGAQMRQDFQKLHESCKDDQEKFCKDIPPGDGRVMACMSKNESKLSEGCKAARKELREKHMNGRAARKQR